jgi:vacuolar-type H+-ATPase subunit H
MKKQSAVEYLVELLNNLNKNFEFAFKEEIEQAKKIQKQQKIDFANDYADQVMAGMNERAEQYYKETFKTK